MIRLYEGVPDPDWLSICQCLTFLDDAHEVAAILRRLLAGSEVRGRAVLFGLGWASFLYCGSKLRKH